MKDWMVDIESLGKRPGCPILSISAVAFDYEADEVDKLPLYAVVAVQPQLDAGLKIDGSTLGWWCEQGKAAQNILESSFDRPACTLPEFMDDWRKAAAKRALLKDVRVWGNGAGFDQPIITAALQASGDGDAVFWNFWNEMCYRTLKNMPVLLGQPKPDLPKPGTAHNAMSDAVAQAQGAVILLRRMAGLPASQYEPALPVAGPTDDYFVPDPMPGHMADALAEQVPKAV